MDVGAFALASGIGEAHTSSADRLRTGAPAAQMAGRDDSDALEALVGLL